MLAAYTDSAVGVWLLSPLAMVNVQHSMATVMTAADANAAGGYFMLHLQVARLS